MKTYRVWHCPKCNREHVFRDLIVTELPSEQYPIGHWRDGENRAAYLSSNCECGRHQGFWNFKYLVNNSKLMIYNEIENGKVTTE